MKQLLVALLAAVLLSSCGGGGSSSITSAAPQDQQLVGEIFAAPSEIGTAEIQSDIGYSGNLPMSRSIRDAGKQNILDLLFMFAPGDAQGRPRNAMAPDAEQKLFSTPMTTETCWCQVFGS